MDLQTGIALAIVAGAAAYLAGRGVRLALAKRIGGCGAGCGGCPASPRADPANLVQIEAKRAKP